MKGATELEELSITINQAVDDDEIEMRELAQVLDDVMNNFYDIEDEAHNLEEAGETRSLRGPGRRRAYPVRPR